MLPSVPLWERLSDSELVESNNFSVGVPLFTFANKNLAEEETFQRRDIIRIWPSLFCKKIWSGILSTDSFQIKK